MHYNVHRDDTRTVTVEGGITSRHCFASGADYDPTNVSWGPIVAFDEHLVPPGRGFDWHPHRGVELVSVVLSGALAHESSDGSAAIVRAGQVAHQVTGAGIRHAERNASGTEPLRFLQTWLVSDLDMPSYRVLTPWDQQPGQWAVIASAAAGGGVLMRARLHPGESLGLPAGRVHLFVVSGAATIADEPLSEGDSVRGFDVAERLSAAGQLDALVWALGN